MAGGRSSAAAVGSSGPVVAWRRADGAAVALGRDVPAITKVSFAGEGRVRGVTRNFNADSAP